ncbi:hypothetical protein NQ318_012354 [Aromia moschata]|uniref:Uncharacterized protein n=1 Tax=Aromia moschata TaxID=1265417 RepID=A0AAV8XJ76_9CUCU|nr:hypothetical protein NQ318_012354 [Aromia moschata]
MHSYLLLQISFQMNMVLTYQMAIFDVTKMVHLLTLYVLIGIFKQLFSWVVNRKLIVIMCLYNGLAAMDYLQCTTENVDAVAMNLARRTADVDPNGSSSC